MIKGEIRILFNWEIPDDLPEDEQKKLRNEAKSEFLTAQSNVKDLLEVWDVVYSNIEAEADFE